MSKSLNRDKKYQVWITSYPLDGSSESSKFDPGHQLIETFATIQDAVTCAKNNHSYEPIITKLVIWKETIIDVSEQSNQLPTTDTNERKGE